MSVQNKINYLFSLGFDIRKSIGGWSVDKKMYNSWMFYAKFSSKKDAINFVETQLNKI